jgi:hypothetical protein
VFNFQRLEEGLLKPHTAGAADDNYYRNRFNSILPCKIKELVKKCFERLFVTTFPYIKTYKWIKVFHALNINKPQKQKQF